jgi:hypothetical protein
MLDVSKNAQDGAAALKRSVLRVLNRPFLLVLNLPNHDHRVGKLAACKRDVGTE